MVFATRSEGLICKRFTFDIDPSVRAINSFVPKIAFAINYLVLEIKITFAYFVFSLWLAGCVAVEDKEEREAEKPEGWF